MTTQEKVIASSIVKLGDNNWTFVSLTKSVSSYQVNTRSINGNDFSIQALPTREIAKRVYDAKLKGVDLEVLFCFTCGTEKNVKAYPAGRNFNVFTYCDSCYDELLSDVHTQHEIDLVRGK